jgi:LacI family transcriptional regulator
MRTKDDSLPPSPPNLKSIADQAGVSVSTVSRALSGSPLLPEATKVRIGRLARLLGYRPDPKLASLMTHLRRSKHQRFTGTLTFVVLGESAAWWKTRHPTIREYYEGARDRAEALGYELEVFWLNEPGMTGKRMSQIWINRGIRGLLFPPLRASASPVRLDWKNFAAVALGYSFKKARLHRVGSNHFQGITLALQRLRRLGYQRIGLALPRSVDTRLDHHWLAGFLVYQNELPQKRRVKPHLPACFFLEKMEFLRWHDQQAPDAVLTNDGNVLEWLGKAGVQVPRQVGVAVLDVAWTRATHPELSGLDQDGRRIGEAGVEIVTAHLNRDQLGLPRTPRLTLIDSLWHPGATVARRTRS